MRVAILFLAVLGSMAATGRAQLPVPAPDEQIAAAVLPLPGRVRRPMLRSGLPRGHGSVAGTGAERPDPASGSVTDAIEKWQSVHFPYRTAEEIGIPIEPERAMPYVMASGTWWSHVMIEHPSHDGPDAIEEEAMTTRASGTFDVKLTPQTATDDAVGATIGRMTLDKQFHGDLEAISKGQMIAAQAGVEGSAGYVAMEEVSGTLHGRRGTFLLQHSGTMTRGEPRLSVTVVPDSGTDQLVGLAGAMTIEIAEDGTHSYEFDYTIPEASTRSAAPRPAARP